MALIQRLITSSKYGIKCPYSMVPQGVCVHNTANDAPAANEISYMQSNNEQVSFHIAVDDKEAIQGIPFNRNTWHSGDGATGPGNRNYISVEICYSKSGGPRFQAAEQRAAVEVAAILKSYGWGVERLKYHKDFSKKNCPHRTITDDFTWKVQVELNKLNLPTAPGVIVGNTVKIIGTHYATGQIIPEWVKAKVHTVKQVAGGKVLLLEINSWVNLKDLVSAGEAIKVGSTVKVTGTKYATGQIIPTWVKNTKHQVKQINNDKALLLEINSWVYISDLVRA